MTASFNTGTGLWAQDGGEGGNTDAGLPGTEQVFDNLSQTTLSVKAPLGFGGERPVFGDAFGDPLAAQCPLGLAGA